MVLLFVLVFSLLAALPLIVCATSPNLAISEQEIRIARAACCLNYTWNFCVIQLQCELISELAKLVIELRQLLLFSLLIELDIIFPVVYLELLR